MDFSVVIRAYNAADRLPEVLDGLRQQIGLEEISWEVVIVDNNSTDNTPEVANRYAQNWRSDCQLRYILEPAPGAAIARRRGVEEAKSDLVGFLDDDNIPKEDWVMEAYKFGKEHPQAGAYGSIINPKFDEDISNLNPQTRKLLALKNPGSAAFCYRRNAKPRIVPAGAGCVFRKQAWQECVPKKLLLQGRKGNSKSLFGSCEDTESLYHIQNSDRWEVWHNPKMEIWHHLSAKRLEPDYLQRIAKAQNLATYYLRLTRLYPWQRPLMILLTPLYLLSDGYKLASYYLRYRDEFESDLTKACELQARIGRFISPFVSFTSN